MRSLRRGFAGRCAVYDRHVARRHDRASASHAPSSRTRGTSARSSAAPARESSASDAPVLDVLSDVLRTVRLTGALYFLVEASSPWEIAVPEGAALAAVVLPRAQHVI